jgi:hypothetical protein
MDVDAKVRELALISLAACLGLGIAWQQGLFRDVLCRSSGYCWRRGRSPIVMKGNLLDNIYSRIAGLVEVCSVNISRPHSDVADWSVHDPNRKWSVQRSSRDDGDFCGEPPTAIKNQVGRQGGPEPSTEALEDPICTGRAS